MKILLVDNNVDFQESFKESLDDIKTLVTANTVASAINEIKNNKFNIIIIDWLLPMESGKVLLDWIHDNKNKTNNAKVWINTSIPVDRIKKYTNGNRVFSKTRDNVAKAICGELLN